MEEIEEQADELYTYFTSESLKTKSENDMSESKVNVATTSDVKGKRVPRHVPADTILIQAKGIKPHERYFRYDVFNIRKAFYEDLKAAGIERIGEDGRCLDVHALRKTFGTLLAKAGVPLTTVQRLMRHSTPLLTAKLYIDVEGVDMMDALEKLPEF